jgi:AcrR family transcriptional regulator
MRDVNDRPRTKPPEERRNELMEAAQHLFLKQGVGATTIEQITAKADVAKGTFYLYFSSKADVRAALGERFAQKHLHAIKTAIAKTRDDDWRGKLATWIRATVTFYLDSIRLHDMLFYESRSPTRQGLVDNIVIDHLSGLLEAGAAARAWSVERPRSAAVFLFSGIHAAVDDAYTKEKRVNRNRLVHTLEQICLATIGLTPA